MNTANDFVNDVFKSLISLNNDIKKTYNMYKDEFNSVLSDVSSGKHKATYAYDNLSPEERKKIIIEKMNFWNYMAKRSDEKSEYLITFKFGKDDEFYFEWNNEQKAFVTVEPNGDKYIYDASNEKLELIDEKKNENSGKPSGVEEKVVDDTAEEKKDDEPKKEKPEYNDHPVSEFSDIEPDKNLAFNLRNKLNKIHEEEDDCDNCHYIFCPREACSNFPEYILGYNDFETDYDEDGNAYQIRFGLDDLAVVNYDKDDDDIKRMTKIYHEESQNLDFFCDLMKETYGFSLGSWNVTFNKDGDDKVVTDISFIFTF